MRSRRARSQGWGAVVAVATCMGTILGVAAQQPALAAAGEMRTFAGGLGEGPATSVAQDPRTLALHGRTLYLPAENILRAVDLDTGLERTVAGNGLPGSSGDGGPATASTLNPGAIAVDTAGNVYVGDGPRLRRIDTAGRITTVAGGGTRREGGVPALEASLGALSGIAVDTAGNVYVSDAVSFKIRRIDSNGTVTIVAGVNANSPTFRGDGGPATQAHLWSPGEMAFDRAGRLYFADGPRVRRVDAEGIITTVAGGGTYPFGASGIRATDATLNAYDVAIDPAGNLLITEWMRVRKVDTAGRITTIAGNGGQVWRNYTEVDAGDGEPAVGVPLSPTGVAVDSGGSVYVTEWGRARIRRIAPSGIITTVAGTGAKFLGGDGGPARQAQLKGPTATAFDRAGNVYIADAENGRVRKVSPGGTISSLPQKFVMPRDVAVDGAGRLYVRSSSSGVLRVDPDGLVTPWAGGGVRDIADGERATVGVMWIQDIAVDPAGALHVIDGSRIRKVDAAGIVTTVAGGGSVPPEDGLPARSATLAPAALAFDSAGRILFTDLATQRIWRTGADGRLTRVAGTTQGFSGDGGPATSAQLNVGPTAGLAVDGADQIFVLDFMNLRVRRIDTAGTITTVAGNGPTYAPLSPWPAPAAEGVPATSATIVPVDIGVDRAGNLYLADQYYNRIRIVPGVGAAVQPPSAATALAAPATRVAGGSAAGTNSEARTSPTTTPMSRSTTVVPGVPTPGNAPPTSRPGAAVPTSEGAQRLSGIATVAAAGHPASVAGSHPGDLWLRVAAVLVLVVAAGATSLTWGRERRRLG